MSNNTIEKKELRSLGNYLAQGSFNFLYAFFKYLDFPLFNYFRFIILKVFTKKIQSTYISDGITFWFPWHLEIGKKCSLNQGCNINAAGGIIIGNNVRIAAYTVMNSVDHIYYDKSTDIKDQGYIKGKIIIEDDVWIGAGVKINKGITIGKGSVIGAGSVVTKDIPPFSVAAGVPAKIIKERA